MNSSDFPDTSDIPNTSSPLAARDHARSQAGATAATTQTIPASAAIDLPAGVRPGDVLWDETLGDGGYASRVLRRGSRLRIEDVDGTACVGLVLYNAECTAERLNVADVVKVQWNAYLGEGRLLLSDMGRVLASIVVDDGGGHDALCGTSSRGRERFLLGLAKHGLGLVDLMPNINLFRSVGVDEDGSLRWAPSSAQPGAIVELQVEMDVLVVLVNTPHVLDPRDAATGGVARVLAMRGEPTGAGDGGRPATPEGLRAFENTDDYHLR